MTGSLSRCSLASRLPGVLAWQVARPGPQQPVLRAACCEEGGRSCFACAAHTTVGLRGVVRARFIATRQMLAGSGPQCVVMSAGITTTSAPHARAYIAFVLEPSTLHGVPPRCF
jgi:hypothetical protein